MDVGPNSRRMYSATSIILTGSDMTYPLSAPRQPADALPAYDMGITYLTARRIGRQISEYPLQSGFSHFPPTQTSRKPWSSISTLWRRSMTDHGFHRSRFTSLYLNSKVADTGNHPL